MSKVIKFPTQPEPVEPIDEIFERLLLDLRKHGYWEPTEESADCNHLCLIFESIQSYIDLSRGKEHMLQKFANTLDGNGTMVVIKKRVDTDS